MRMTSAPLLLRLASEWAMDHNWREPKRSKQMRVLPADCVYSPVTGASYYSCAGAWFSPSYGANGV